MRTKDADMPSFVYLNKGVLQDAYRFDQAESTVRKKSILNRSIRFIGRSFYRIAVLIIFSFYYLITTINHNMKRTGKRPHANRRLDSMWPPSGNVMAKQTTSSV